jgi:hypothetical protein
MTHLPRTAAVAEGRRAPGNGQIAANRIAKDTRADREPARASMRASRSRQTISGPSMLYPAFAP